MNVLWFLLVAHTCSSGGTHSGNATCSLLLSGKWFFFIQVYVFLHSMPSWTGGCFWDLWLGESGLVPLGTFPDSPDPPAGAWGTWLWGLGPHSPLSRLPPWSGSGASFGFWMVFPCGRRHQTVAVTLEDSSAELACDLAPEVYWEGAEGQFLQRVTSVIIAWLSWALPGVPHRQEVAAHLPRKPSPALVNEPRDESWTSSQLVWTHTQPSRLGLSGNFHLVNAKNTWIH